MKALSKNKLIFLVILNSLFLSRKKGKKSAILYIKDIKRSKNTFHRYLQKKDQKFDENYLIGLFNSAIVFRANKKIIKSTIANFFNTILQIGLMAGAMFIPYFFITSDQNFWYYLLVYLVTLLTLFIVAYLTIYGIQYFNNYEIKIGKIATRMMQTLFIVGICSLIFYVFKIEKGFLRTSLLTSYYIIYFMITLEILEHLVAQIFVDAWYYSKKIKITEALIIASSYKLATINWSIVFKSKPFKQDVLLEIERLANLIESDWSTHLFPGDERTSKWMKHSLKGIAEDIRYFKRKIIIPSPEMSTELRRQFDEILVKILQNDYQGLIGAQTPALRIRKRSKLAIFQSIVVTFLPISISLCIKYYYPGLLKTEYLNFAILISGFWVMLSLLLWLDPNLSDKISTVKSIKSIYKGNEHES